MFESRPSLYFLASFCSCGLVSLNGCPALHRVGQEARARGLQRPFDAFGDLDRGAPQHLRVELVGAALDFPGDLVEQRDQHGAVDLEAVARGLLGERFVDAGLPVDQRAVDVECDKGDVFRDWHRAGHYALPRAPARAHPRLPLESRAANGPVGVPGQAAVRPPRPEGLLRQGGDHASRTPSRAADEIGYPVVVKAQVLIGGRGKAGGVKLAADEARGARARRATSSAWTSAGTSCARCGSSTPRTSPPSTTPRCCSTARPSSRW